MYAPHAVGQRHGAPVPTRTVNIEMTQFEFTAGVVYRFGN